jgi:Tol biopolymer transport system component
MKFHLRIGLLPLGVLFLAACQQVSTPEEPASAKAPPSPTASAMAEPHPLSECNQASSTNLGDLQLAVAAKWDGDDEIYLIRADGSDRVQITFNDSRDIEPAWSPDGGRLAYVVNADTGPRVYISGPDGTEGRIVAADTEAKPGHSALEWSPKGDKLAFQNSEDLFVVDVVTNQIINLTRDAKLFPRELSFSRDGSMLAFTAGRPSDSDSGRYRLYIINVDGTGLRELRFPVEPVFWPDWHPREDKILFEGILPGVSVGLYVTSPDGTWEQLPMQRGSTSDLRAAWSPDGSMVGYIFGFVGVDSGGQRLSRNSIHVATAEGDIDLELVQSPAQADVELRIHDIVWGPDGRHIAYTTFRGKGSDVLAGDDLFVLDICDGSSILVVEEIDFYSTPSWRPLP